MSNRVSYFMCLAYTLSHARILYKRLCLGPLIQYCIECNSAVSLSPGCPEASIIAVVMYADCCTVLLYFSGYCTVKLTLFSLLFVFVCFLCIICVKSTINLLQYSIIHLIVLSGT